MFGKTVTLLSDWGNSDHYAAVVRAKVLSLIPEANVVDISHSVPRHDIYAAAFMMCDSYRYFPEGSVHIIGVDDIASSVSPHVVVKLDNHFFIGADNGFFTVLQALSGKKLQEVYEIDVWQDTEVYTFPARDLFSKVAAMIAEGRSMEDLGHPTSLHPRMLDGGLFPQRTPQKSADGRETGIVLTGRVIYIDYFGNLITNITEEQFKACTKNYSFMGMYVGWKIQPVKIVKAYMDVGEADIAFIFLENGFLEISVNHDSAANLLGMNKTAMVNLHFGQVKK